MSKQLKQFTVRLRELLTGLERSAGSAVPATEAPPEIVQALVATRLLREQGGQTGDPAGADWLEALLDLLEWLQRHRPSLTADYRLAVAELVRIEEGLLAGIDDGGSLTDLLLAGDLQSLQIRLEQAVCEPPARGDPTPAPISTHSVPAPGARVLLLMASPFRASLLTARLVGAGYEVVHAASPAVGLALLTGSTEYLAVLCDDTLPGRFLQRLRRQWERPLTGPLLLLVTGGGGRRLREHAGRLGADGVWGAPYRIADFRALTRQRPRPS